MANEKNRQFYQYIYDSSVFKRLETALNTREPLNTLNDDESVLLKECMQKNYEHALFAEKQRDATLTIFGAISAVGLAVVKLIDFPSLVQSCFTKGIGVAFVLAYLVAAYMAFSLCFRWCDVYEKCLTYCKWCYSLLHRSAFGKPQDSILSDDEKPKERYLESIGFKDQPINPGEGPAYCFGVPTRKLIIHNRGAYKVLAACFLAFAILEGAAAIWALFSVPIG